MLRDFLKWLNPSKPTEHKEVEMPKDPAPPMVWYHDAHVYKHTQPWFKDMTHREISYDHLISAIDFTLDYYNLIIGRVS